MSSSAEDLEVKISTEGAQSFIDWFYTQVSDRKPLDNFYVNSNTKYVGAGASADISINGFVCATPADFSALLETQATGRSSGNRANAKATLNGGASTNGRSGSGAASSASSASAFIAQRVRYDVDGFDAQVLNPNFRIACPDQLLQRLSNSAGASNGMNGNINGNGPSSQLALRQKMASLLVQVTGQVVYGGGKDATRGPFTEVFVLVPNWDVLVGGARAPRGLRSHLILSQNFRAL